MDCVECFQQYSVCRQISSINAHFILDTGSCESLVAIRIGFVQFSFLYFCIRMMFCLSKLKLFTVLSKVLCIFSCCISGTIVVVRQLDLQLPLQSVPITTNVNLKPTQPRCTPYNIVIKFVGILRYPVLVERVLNLSLTCCVFSFKEVHKTREFQYKI